MGHCNCEECKESRDSKENSICGVLALIIVVCTFILIQMQFNGFHKRVVANEQQFNAVNTQVVRLLAFEDHVKAIFWKHGHKLIDHSHRYYDGRVRTNNDR